jgi:hypothetical protein
LFHHHSKVGKTLKPDGYLEMEDDINRHVQIVERREMIPAKGGRTSDMVDWRHAARKMTYVTPMVDFLGFTMLQQMGELIRVDLLKCQQRKPLKEGPYRPFGISSG